MPQINSMIMKDDVMKGSGNLNYLLFFNYNTFVTEKFEFLGSSRNLLS